MSTIPKEIPIREQLRKYISGKSGCDISINRAATDLGCLINSIYVPITELESEGLIKKRKTYFTVLPINQLATDGREEDVVPDFQHSKDDEISALVYNCQQYDEQIKELQSSLKEKEKECIQQQEAIDRAATIMDEKGKQIFLLNKDMLESLRVNDELRKEIERLKHYLLTAYPILALHYRNKGNFLQNEYLDAIEKEIESIKPNNF